VARQRRQPAVVFQSGDTLQMTVYEASRDGLFINADSIGRTGNYVTLPQLVVDQSGNIRVPFAGSVRAAGRTAGDVQREIESRLATKAVEPQVFLTVATPRGSEVTVLGDVNSAAKFSLNPAGERVADAIARAGGIKSAGYETYVTLQRGRQSSKVPFETLVRHPQENVFVFPGDTIYVSREPRSFTILGATGTNNRVTFAASSITLADAVGSGGGLLDSRAGPNHLYLYRTESRALLQRLGLDLRAFDPGLSTIPVVYQADLSNPSALFAAQKFGIRDGDVIYVANAESVEIVKLFGVLSSITQPLAQGANGSFNIRRTVQ
jgi:polysaccharide export outer membrane protein